MTVHPHARGEHVKRTAAIVALTGSSPRAWGTLEWAGCHLSRPWFIPTRVGNTPRSGHAPAGRTVHPHARGEHMHHSTSPSLDVGSSPRAWGTHHHSIVTHLQLRFIPTRVGNTCAA